MGMRRNIALSYDDKSAKIYLYTHWGAEGLENTLAASLNRARERWNDDSYLARVIALDMFKEAGEDLTGYGLSPFEIDPEFPTLEVDLNASTVNGVPFEDFIKNPQMFAI